jgi:FeS assembly SUF system regulator
MLRITKQTDYSIVLMTKFAADEPQAVHNARDLAQSAGLPLPTVSKILKALARAGLLVSHRGVKGGYGLARPPSEIAVDEVIEALEGPIAITECLHESHDQASCCGIQGACPVQANWGRINDAVKTALSGIPLSEMVAPDLQVAPERATEA